MIEDNISKFVSGNKLRVFAKPGKKKTKIVSFDEARNALVIEVGAPAEDNKANIELTKFLSRQLKKPIVLKSGFTSKEKVFVI